MTKQPPPALGSIPSLQLLSLPSAHTAHTEDAKSDWILRNFLACRQPRWTCYCHGPQQAGVTAPYTQVAPDGPETPCRKSHRLVGRQALSAILGRGTGTKEAALVRGLH